MNTKTEFTIGDVIVVRAMREGEIFDPKVLLIDPADKTSLRVHSPVKCYFPNNLVNLINQTKPFCGVREIELLPVLVDNSFWGEDFWANLTEVEKKDFFSKRMKLTTEEFLWVMFRLLQASDNPKAENPPLLNKNEFATYLIDLETITMFQLVGSYSTPRGWSCAFFQLNKLNKKEKEKRLMNKILLPC